MDKKFTLRSAVYLILEKDNKILLSRRYKTGWMDGKYSLISGHLDGKESISEAMIREAKEEAGIIIIKQDCVPAHVMHRFSPNDSEYIDFFYITKKWKGVPKIMEPQKCDQMAWYPIDNLPNSLLPYINTALNNYKKRVPFSEVGWNE